MQNLLPELKIQSNVSYKKITTFGVGKGVVPIVAEPDSMEQLIKLIDYLNLNSIEFFILGAGSNIVGSDNDYTGVIIRLKEGIFKAINVDPVNQTCRVGCGVKIAELARFVTKYNLGGLAPLSGIPATLGGATIMNAGANGVNISAFIEQIYGVTYNGQPWSANSKDMDWSYRHSPIPQDVIVTEITLKLNLVDAPQELSAIATEIEQRRSKEPKMRNAGCIFRNFGANSAGEIIDRARLKGLCHGDLMVSNEHANYIVNCGDGSCESLLTLMNKIRQSVATKYGIYLASEVKFIDKNISQSPAPPKIALLKGGSSSERAISLRSGTAVAEALRNSGYDVIEVDILECAVTQEMLNADLVYPVLHGGFGENGDLQQLLEAAEINFVGSGSVASKLVMDKIATKERLDKLGLPNAKWAVVTPENTDFPNGFNFPVVVKAPWEGSTIGIALVENQEDWAPTLEKLFEYDTNLLVESFVKGVEITVPIVSGKVLPAIEICSPNGFYDFDAKYVYQNGKTQYLCPTQNVSETALTLANEYALKFFNEFGCRDILRVDFIIDDAGVPYILEGNSIPGCTATSLVPKAAKVAGISFEEMVSNIVKNRLNEENL